MYTPDFFTSFNEITHLYFHYLIHVLIINIILCTYYRLFEYQYVYQVPDFNLM